MCMLGQVAQHELLVWVTTERIHISIQHRPQVVVQVDHMDQVMMVLQVDQVVVVWAMPVLAEHQAPAPRVKVTQEVLLPK